MDKLGKKDIQKLDYETCNQLRFSFRDNVHKYALMYIVFISAYLAYEKYTLDQFPAASSNAQAAYGMVQNNTNVQNIVDHFKEPKYPRFLPFVGIAFGISLSLSFYVGLRMYCRNRSLSVCAIRTQQILRDRTGASEAPLLSGLKVLNHQKYHAAIPHGISRGEYQTVFLLCILASAPIFLSYPFFDLLSLLFKGTYLRSTEACWLLTWIGFLFFCANTAENTFGHLSEADAITNVIRVPILRKKWGNEGRDPGNRIFRKEWQRTFYRGYAFLFVLLLFIHWYNPISKVFNWTQNHILSCLIYFQNYIFIFSLSCFLLAMLLKMIGIITTKVKFRSKLVYSICMIGYLVFLLTVCKYAGVINPFLSASKLFWLSFAAILSVKIVLLIKYKIERFSRLSMLLQSQAIYYSIKEYGIYNSEKKMSPSDIENFTLDVLAYKIFKKSCFTYKECFNHEDCRKHGDFFNKLLKHEKTKRLRKTYKIISLIYPKLGRIIYDCWNVEKIKEEFYMSIKKDGNNKDRIAVFFPTWLGDCIMAMGAVKIVNGNFDESVTCVPILNEKQNKILGYDTHQSLILPEMPKTSLKHAGLRIFSNWFKKITLNNSFVHTLDRESLRAAFFFNRNHHLAGKIKTPTLMYNETAIREGNNNDRNRHRVDLMAQFITDNLKKMGYEENTIKRDGKQEYSINIRSNGGSRKKIGIFPFGSNDNKYKGWSSGETAKLINSMKEKYRNNIEIVMFESGMHKRYINQINKNVKSGAVTFCPENCDEFKKMSYIITIDTGSLHLAQFYNIPSTGLYGPTHPYETGPYPNGYEHCVVKTAKNRSTDNVRVDKKIVLAKMLLVDDVFDNVCKHLDKLGIL